MTIEKNKAIFLDRDGTLIVEKHYLHRPEEIEIEKNVIPALRLLQEHGFKLIVVTNQAGIGKGFFTVNQFLAAQSHLNSILNKENIFLTDFFYCPYHINASIERFRKNSIDRKPRPGMLKRAIKKYNIDPSTSYMIGDKLIDVQAGQSLNIQSILLKTGYGTSELPSSVPDYIAQDLLDATQHYIL